jgi:hypothetical protein
VPSGRTRRRPTPSRLAGHPTRTAELLDEAARAAGGPQELRAFELCRLDPQLLRITQRSVRGDGTGEQRAVEAAGAGSGDDVDHQVDFQLVAQVTPPAQRRGAALRQRLTVRDPARRSRSISWTTPLVRTASDTPPSMTRARRS